MSRKRKIVLISLVALPLAAVLAALLWPGTPAAPPQSIKLPNGVAYQLAGVTFGTNHVIGTRAAKLVYKLPVPIQKFTRKILGKRFPDVQGVTITPQPALIVWFDGTSPNAPSLAAAIGTRTRSQITAVLADENGVESGAQLIVIYLSGGRARFAEFPVLPRRSRTLQIRFYQSEPPSKILGEIGSFQFPNPVYGKFPQWTPDTGPLVRKAGDLEVRLDNFQVGKGLAGPHITLPNRQRATDYGPVHKGERAETIFDLTLISAEGVNSPWLLQNAVVSDATGNTLDGSFLFVPANSDGISTGLSPMGGLGNSRRSLNGALWPDESAWKLRLDFKRTTGFDTNELVTFKSVPVPAIGTTNKPGLRLRVGEGQLTLAEFFRGPVPTADELEASRTASSVLYLNRVAPTFIRLEIPSRRDGLAVDFVRLTSDAGDESRLSVNHWYPGGRLIGMTALSTNAKTVDITLSVQKTRSVEFLLKPPK
jgi:hypothetical protein